MQYILQHCPFYVLLLFFPDIFFNVFLIYFIFLPYFFLLIKHFLQIFCYFLISLVFPFHGDFLYIFFFISIWFILISISSRHSCSSFFHLAFGPLSLFIHRQVWWCISLFDFKPVKPYLIIISPSACFKLSRSYPFDLLSLLIFITVFDSLWFWPTAKTEKNISFVILSTKIKQRIHKKKKKKLLNSYLLPEHCKDSFISVGAWC